MKKKALILLGHQQSMVNFCALFKSIGIDTFAPPYADDKEKNHKSTYQENSTIWNDTLTDRYNLFDQNISEKDADEIYSIINSMGFDFIISYFFISWKINTRLINLNCPKYFLVWGDGHTNPLTVYEAQEEFQAKFTESSDSKYIFCHKHLLDTASKNLPESKNLQLNIPIKDMGELENSWDYSHEFENTVLIVCSRVFSSNQNIKQVFDSCRNWLFSLSRANPNINFLLIGKDNSNNLNESIPNNLSIHECCKVDEVFLFMQKCRLMLYFHPILFGESSGNIIQYSQIEASCIGIPMIHCSKSRAIDYMGTNSDFVFSMVEQPHINFNHESLSKKLNYLFSRSRVELKQMSLYQKNLYFNYKVETIKSRYINALSL